MDITHTDSPPIKDGIIDLVLTGADGSKQAIQLRPEAAVRLASVLLFQLAQLPTESAPIQALQVASVPCRFAVTVALPDVQVVVARIGPLNVSLGPLESLKHFLSQESALLQEPSQTPH